MLGQRLRQVRKEKSLTLQQVADALGVTRACVSKWETGTSSPDLIRLESIANVLGLSARDLLGNNHSSSERPQVTDYPVLTLEHGTPFEDLLSKQGSSSRRYPSPHPLSPSAFFVALGGYMVAHFGLDGVPRGALLLIEPQARPQSGDLVLAHSKSLGYQVLAVRDGPTKQEYLSLGIKLSHLGPIEDAAVLGVAIEAVNTQSLRGFALRQSPQLLFA
jgi:transcriptional regulator with XRE-family HTH domain